MAKRIIIVFQKIFIRSLFNCLLAFNHDRINAQDRGARRVLDVLPLCTRKKGRPNIERVQPRRLLVNPRDTLRDGKWKKRSYTISTSVN